MPVRGITQILISHMMMRIYWHVIAWVLYVNALLPQLIHLALAVLKLCHLENTHL